MQVPTIIIIEITAPEIVPITEIVLTLETVLITEIALPITTEPRPLSPIEIVAQPETIHKGNPETITINTIEQTQVKTINVHQTVILQATTPTEAVAVVCLEEVLECLAAVVAQEHPVVVAEDNK
jgi:hypothetical protein